MINALYMNIFFYKLRRDCELGKKAARLLKDMEEAEEAADKLAGTYGAQEYFYDPNHDSGGMVAVLFPKTMIVNKDLWEKTQLGDNPDCWVPKVKIREELMETVKAETLQDSKDVVVSKEEMPFEYVRFRFSREEAAKMAGVKLTTPSLERIGKRNNISRRILNMLSMGADIDFILENHYSEDIKTEIRLSLIEDNQIADAMRGRTFKLVHFYEGNKNAIRIYQDWMNLPVVPTGTVNALLGVKCDTHRCGISEHGEWVYITSAMKIENDALTEVSQKEFENVTNIILPSHENEN